MTIKHFKKPTTLLFALLGLVALFAVVGWSPSGQANSGETMSQTNPNDVNDKFASLESKARQAKSGNETAVKSLADEVIAQFGFADMNDALSEVKDRFVNSEVNYRREGKGGISERKLVNSLNKLTKQLDAPDFAKVSVAQVRYLRVNLLTASPSLIGQLPEKHLGKSGLNPEMSPLEAAAVAMLLVTQKLSNEDFQVTPEEWAQKRHQRQVAKWEAHRRGIHDPVDRLSKARIVTENAKSKELEQALRNHAWDIEPLIDGLLADIGISAEGGKKQ